MPSSSKPFTSHSKYVIKNANTDGITALVSRLDALERRLGCIDETSATQATLDNESATSFPSPWRHPQTPSSSSTSTLREQERPESACSACKLYTASGGPCKSPRCVLWDEARPPLRDCVAECRPTVLNNHRQGESYEGRAPKGAHAKRNQCQGTLRTKTTDRVNRYQEMQRIWARDPFLKSGGDGRVSRRRTEGFRDAFGAMHSDTHHQ